MSYFLLKARLAVHDIGQNPFLGSFSADGPSMLFARPQGCASRRIDVRIDAPRFLHFNTRFGPSPDLNLCAVGTVELILINLNAGVNFNDAPVSSLSETRRSCPMFELGH